MSSIRAFSYLDNGNLDGLEDGPGRGKQQQHLPTKVIRCSEWQHRQNLAPDNCAVNLDESLAKGRHTSPWAAWRCLNRLRTGVACSMVQPKRWKYFNGDTTCECGQASETTKHMLQCQLLAHPCTLDDLQKFNKNARKCVDKWKSAV